MASARSKVSRPGPTLPPSASSASAESALMSDLAFATTNQRHPDIGKDRGDRRMRLAHRHPYRGHACKPRQQSVRDRAGGRFDQPVALRREGAVRGLHDGRVGHRVDELVRAALSLEVDRQFEVEHEPLADLGFVLHHAVMSMDHKPAHEDPIAHLAARMAAATFNACTVSATSWARMMR